jgi:tetrahydromethanopterin S-methyltransferase subunit G
MEMATLDDLSNMARYLESEIEGEKVLTRHIFDSTRRHAEELSALRVEISALRLVNERIGGDVALVKTAQMSQGQMLNILVQDVREIRTRLDGMEHKLGRLDGIEHRLDGLEHRLDGLERRLDGLERKLDMLIAAVVPGNPLPV